MVFIAGISDSADRYVWWKSEVLIESLPVAMERSGETARSGALKVKAIFARLALSQKHKPFDFRTPPRDMVLSRLSLSFQTHSSLDN